MFEESTLNILRATLADKFKIYNDCLFAVRTEFENPEASKEYIEGYLKGVKACLFDLGFRSETVTKVVENMLYIRSYVKGECDEELE